MRANSDTRRGMADAVARWKIEPLKRFHRGLDERLLQSGTGSSSILTCLRPKPRPSKLPAWRRSD
jgi:hypothetical protein